MITEYLKKSQGFFKWLVPFVLAVFLLFGCSSPAQKSVDIITTSETEAVSQTVAEDKTEAEAETETDTEAEAETETETAADEAGELDKDGSYTGKEDVALYIHTYGKLPNNFITKKQAEDAGWVSKEGNLWEVATGKSIGGSRFGNYEGQLPEQKGRTYKECDIDFDGSYRGAKRIIFSNDGLIFYTGDHYKTFEQLY